jgi:hypothetical protein
MAESVALLTMLIMAAGCLASLPASMDESIRFLTLAEAAARSPGRPHKNTVARWASRGVYGVKLRSARIGGKRLVRADWLEDFLARLIAASPDAFHGDDIGSTSHQLAEAKLDALGV